MLFCTITFQLVFMTIFLHDKPDQTLQMCLKCFFYSMVLANPKLDWVSHELCIIVLQIK